nr:MAG TPA: Integrase [Caudoviricetes sp.]DAP83540.1 MAG TPA: Integrase [Caudoviricetes sp.]
MNDILQYALENGIINLSHIQEQIEMNKREEILKEYRDSIWKASDGYWKIRMTYDETGQKKMFKRKSKQDLEDLIVKTHREKVENPTMSTIFNEWVQRKVDLNKISIQTYQRYKQDFNRFFKELGKQKIRSLEPEDISNFLEEQISEHNLSAKGFSNLKTITRGTLKWAKRNKLIDWNVQELFYDLDVTDKSFKKTVKEDSEEVFNDMEMDRVIEYLKERPDMINLGLLLMFVTGLRVGELAALKWDDWIYNKDDQSASIIKVRRTEIRHFKNHKGIFEVKDFPKTEAGVRNVVIPQNCTWILQKLRTMSAFYEYVFWKDGQRINTYTFRNRLRTVCKNTNCIQKSPHKIRKTYCTILLDHSIDNQMVISQMGHTNISCSENYYHRDRKDLAKKQKIMDSIDEFMVVSK